MGLQVNNSLKILFNELVDRARLSDVEKQLWHSLIEKSSDNELDAIFTAVQDDPENLIFLTSNLLKKQKALKAGNKRTWSAVVAEEK